MNVRRRAVILICIGLLLGLSQDYFGVQISFLFVIILFVFRYKKQAYIYLLVLLLSYNIGLSRAAPYMQDTKTMEALWGQSVIVEGKVTEDPSYHESGQRQFHIDHIHLIEPSSQKVNGLVRVRSYVPNIYRGDMVRVEGKIYRALGNRHGSIQYAKVEVINRSTSVLEKLRLDFFAAAFTAIPDPESSLGLGFLVGVGNTLPKELNDNLRATGLTHIVAVSGYNLTILVLLARRLFANQSKNLSFMVAVSLLVVFLFLTGGAPSIVRASIVSFLSIWAWYYGRSANPLILLVVSAAISGYINPYFIWKDIGWYLSFTAFFGVLALAPQITKRIYNKEPKILGQLLIETSCAQILTFPVVAYIFGDISVVSLLANLLVLPLVPLAMAMTFVSGVSQLMLPSISGLLSIPARYILGYIVEIAELLANTTGALVELKLNLHQATMVYAIILMITSILFFSNQRRLKNTSE